MKVTLGKDEVFPETAECCHCKGRARIAFAGHETVDEAPHIADLHRNEGKGGYWPHDLCSVAVYFCRECLKATALYEQA